MSNDIQGNLTQRPNRLNAPVEVHPNVLEGKFAPPRDAYQLAKLLDPTIGTLEEWIASLQASPIQMQVAGGYIQWKLESEGVWFNLLALEEITGQTGANGMPGDYAKCLGVFASLSEFKALYGNYFPQGLSDWAFAVDDEIAEKLWVCSVRISTQTSNPEWFYTDLSLPTVNLRVAGGYIQWQTSESSPWNNLLPLADLTGPQGPQGNQPFYYQGEYDNGADYAIGDAVTYLGSLWYRSGEPNPGYPPGSGSPYWTLLVEKGSTGDKGEPSYCIGVFASVGALLSAWPDGPGMEHLNYWAFAMDADNDRILWLYRPDPLNNGVWAREQIDLPVVPLDTATNLGGATPSDLVAPSQAAVRTYVDARTYADVGAAPAGHNHDDQYYTKTETNTLLSSKVPTSRKINGNDLTSDVTITLASLNGQPAGSYATLEDGKVPAAQLPSYVDDVLEFDDVAHFPTEGSAGIIYVARDVNRTYRWGGSAYFEISASPVQSVNGQTDAVVLDHNSVGADAAGAADAVQQNLDIDKAFTYLHLSSGVVSGGALSRNVADPTKFDISDGTGYVVDYWTSPGAPVVTKVTWAGKTGLTTPLLTGLVSTTVMIDAGGNVITQSGPASRSDYSRYIVLGKLLHPNRTTITGVSQYHHSISGSIGNGMDLMHFMGTLANGVTFAPYGGSEPLKLTRNGGTLLRIGGNYPANRETPNITTISSQSPASFFYRYRDGSGGYKIDPSTESFNPSAFDSSGLTGTEYTGSLATLQNSKYANHRIYVFTSGNAYVVPGQNEYNSLSAAVAAIPTESFAVDPQLVDANLRCVISCKGGASSLQAADVHFTQGGLMGVLGGSAGGGTTVPGGASYDIQYNNNGSFGGAAITGLVKAQGSAAAPVAATPDVDYATPESVSSLHNLAIAYSIALG